MQEISCSEPGCRQSARFLYHHEGHERGVCEGHQRAVEHRMDALGLSGPLNSRAVQFAPLWRPDDSVDWQAECSRLIRTGHATGQQLAQMTAAADALTLQLETVQGELRAATIERDDLRVLVTRYQRAEHGDKLAALRAAEETAAKLKRENRQQRDRIRALEKQCRLDERRAEREAARAAAEAPPPENAPPEGTTVIE
jgi:hypothetical protein